MLKPIKGIVYYRDAPKPHYSLSIYKTSNFKNTSSIEMLNSSPKI